MHISIWQQFSSNHSAGFCLVGTFQSAEFAVQVEEEIRQILVTTALWDEDKAISGRWQNAITPANLEFFAKYGIEWSHHIDWLLGLQHAEHAIKTIDRAVFLADSPGYSPSSGANPFVDLMRALGADVITAEETAMHSAYYTISCTAPDEDAVKAILADVERRKTTEASYLIKGITWFGFEDISHQGLQITFYDGYFQYKDLFNLVQYLKALRCQNIRAQFRATDDTFQVKGWSMRSVYTEEHWIAFDTLDVQKPFWVRFESWSDIAHNAQIAIATFKTADAAIAAFKSVMHILQSVDQWAEENPEQARHIRDVFWERISPPERIFQEEFHVAWNYSLLEWLLDARQLNRLDSVACILDNLLLIENPCRNLIGIEPFPAILEKLGASVVSVIPWERQPLVVDITCTAPSQTAADNLFQILANYGSASVPPWFSYRGGEFQKLSDETDAAIEQVLAYEKYLDLLSQTTEQFTYKDNTHRVQEQIAQLQKTHLLPIQLTDYGWVWWLLHAVQFEIDPAAILLERETLILRSVDFSKHSLAQGLPTLIGWLRAQNCRVEYRLYRKS